MPRSALLPGPSPTLALLALLVVPTLLAAGSPALAAPPAPSPGIAIESYSPFQGQLSCDPVARPGVTAFRDLVLSTYPGTSDAGIVRACTTGGASEHKQGRAWDWRVRASDVGQAAQATDLLTWLLATDEHGNTAAVARRLGVMYVIWNSSIWKSYQADRGWQPYVGASAHTDHVHISFSWSGALGQTSFWTGQVSPVVADPTRPAPVQSGQPATSTVPIGSPDGVPQGDAVENVPASGPTPPPVDRRTQAERRRAAVANLPGPWRRR